MNNLIRGKDLFRDWKADLLTGRKPIRFALADDTSPLSVIQAGPGLVSLWGGMPGIGKTAVLNQLFFDGLRLNEKLRVLIANVEMTPQTLLDRQLSRLSGIDLESIQSRDLGPQHSDRLSTGLAELETVIERLGFVRGPFTIEAVAAAADKFEPDLICLDYLQRFTAAGDIGDKRTGVSVLMNFVRGFADAGACCFIVSALARTKNSQGRQSYDAEALSMATFRDSSELEYGTDAAYILVGGKERNERTLLNLKSRNGECRDIALEFDGAVQRFSGTFIDDVVSQAAGWWDK